MPKFVWGYFFAYSTLYGMIEAQRFGIAWGRYFFGAHIIPYGKQAAKLELPACCIVPATLTAQQAEQEPTERPINPKVVSLSGHCVDH